MNNYTDKLLWGITLFKLRYNRGNSWMNQIKDIGNLIIALYAAKSLLAEAGIPFLSGKLIIVLAVGEVFVGYFIGWADEMKLFLWQRENIYASTKLNPINNDMVNNVAELCKRGNTTVAGEVMKIACCPDCIYNQGRLRLLYNQQTSILSCPKCSRSFDAQNTDDMEQVKWV